MNILTDDVPAWISILFLLVIPIPVFLIANLARRGAKTNGQIVFWCVLIFYILYFTYVTVACLNGAFEMVSLPPRIMVLTAVPLLVFLVLVVFNLPGYKSILDRLTLPDLVKIHIFRLIGSFFLILAYHEALPKVFASIAGIGDVLTAMTSLVVARIFQQKKKYALKLATIWNTFGLLDILTTAAMAFFITKISIETGAQGVDALAKFPFCYIPAFAPATIVFLHLSVYRKLLHLK